MRVEEETCGPQELPDSLNWGRGRSGQTESQPGLIGTLKFTPWSYKERVDGVFGGEAHCDRERKVLAVNEEMG